MISVYVSSLLAAYDFFIIPSFGERGFTEILYHEMDRRKILNVSAGETDVESARSLRFSTQFSTMKGMDMGLAVWIDREESVNSE